MRGFLLVALGVAGCGNSATHHLADAPVAEDTRSARDAAPDSPRDSAPDARVDAGVDAAPVPCTFVAATSTSNDVLAYTLTGGAFESFGCAPIDPTYWMSGAGMSLAVTFVSPQARPSLRIWGMNDDDTASVEVNGSAYSLDAASASLTTKVVCGVSPGPDAMDFVNGDLTSVESNGAGNYSYQDLIIEQPAVTSIRIAGLTGAGWGVAGASVGSCASQTSNQ